jgi:hypothetical protein
MPAELVKSDLARGILVKIVAADAPPKGFVLSMHAGIAARWLKDIQRRRRTGRKRI